MTHSSQRNTYLTGFCLFLSLVLTRTFYIILDLIHTQEQYAKLKEEVRLSSFQCRVSFLLTQSPSIRPHPNLAQMVLLGHQVKSKASKRDWQLPKQRRGISVRCLYFAWTWLLTARAETLKKQAAQQAAEFNKLSDKYNEVTGSNSDKRRD